MRTSTILTITRRADWLVGVRSVLHGTGRRRLIVAESMDEAGGLLDVAEPHLIILHDDEPEFSYEQLDRMLWANSVRSRPAPVLVVVNGYCAEQATVLFRMGIDEYVCEVEHGDRLGPIIASLLPQPAACGARGAYGGSTSSGRMLVAPPAFSSIA
jgi:hypothetical protein